MMRKDSLLPYKIGLAVIGVFALGLMIYIFGQASSTKADTKTYNAANDIANKLNDYINNQGLIPDTLQAAGISNVPSEVSYTKVSDQTFKFCVTYKANSSGVSNASITDTLINLQGSPANTGSSSSTNMLFLDPDHKKGANCQTVTPPYLSPAPTPTNYPDINGGSGQSSNTYNFGTTGTQG